MSTPIPNFQKLTISPIMQSSRGRRAGASGNRDDKSKGKAVAQHEDSSDDSDTSDTSDSEEDQVEDSQTLQEDENEIPEPEHIFALDHCRQYGVRYAFQLACASVERYGIRIHQSEPSECSCKESNCRHYAWLLKEIAQARRGSPISRTDSPHEQISSIGLKNICDELQWELRESNEDQEDTKWLLKKDYSVQAVPRQSRAITRERLKIIQDIMATLSPIASDDYRTDLFNATDELPMSPLVVGDLETTLALLLIKNDDILYQFKGLVSRDLRATEYFRKMTIKAQDTCFRLDYYCEHGTAAGQQPHDLIWCAQTLVGIVDKIAINIVERQPLSSESRVGAAAALVSILLMVVKDRNYDTYQNSNIPRRRPHGERSVDRNLYERLIGCGTSPKNPSGGNFILDVLQDLPEARLYIEDLDEALNLLSTIGWGPAPRAYRNKLERVIAQLRGETGSAPPSHEGGVVGTGASLSTSKRHAPSVDRKAKRMK